MLGEIIHQAHRLCRLPTRISGRTLRAAQRQLPAGIRGFCVYVEHSILISRFQSSADSLDRLRTVSAFVAAVITAKLSFDFDKTSCDISTTQDDAKDVPNRVYSEATIGHLKLPPNGQKPYIVAAGVTGREEMTLEYTAEKVRVNNARPEFAAGTISFSTTGLALVRSPTGLSSAEFYTDAGKVTSVYYDEVCRAVKAVTGADVVIAFHHQIRNEKIARSGQLLMDNSLDVGSVDAYSTNAHADYSPRIANDTVRQLCHRMSSADKKRLKHTRYVLINAWRSISDSEPIQKNHLALLDGTTLAPHDMALVDLHYRAFSSESVQLVHPTKRAHRWWYFPHMQKDELLLFTNYDPDPTAAVRYTFHTGFNDVNAPEDAAPRQSIEVRTVAFLPCMSEDALTTMDSLLNPLSAAEIAGQICVHVSTPEHWPEDTRAAVSSGLAHDRHGTALGLMRSMIAWHANPANPDGLMQGASAELKEDVLKILIASDFQERLSQNFGAKPRK